MLEWSVEGWVQVGRYPEVKKSSYKCQVGRLRLEMKAWKVGGVVRSLVCLVFLEEFGLECLNDELFM